MGRLKKEPQISVHALELQLRLLGFKSRINATTHYIFTLEDTIYIYKHSSDPFWTINSKGLKPKKLPNTNSVIKHVIKILNQRKANEQANNIEGITG